MTGRERAERRAAVSAGHGFRARWAGRRLHASARRGDTDARNAMIGIARTPEHRLHRHAKSAIAAWWTQTRSDVLRQAVLETGAVARDGLPRLQTLALLDRLAGNWDEADARWAGTLLDDRDPDVRRRAAAVCRDAAGALHGALWAAVSGPFDPLRELLLREGRPPPAPTLDALWADWILAPAEPLGDALFRWGRPVSDTWRIASGVAALQPDSRPEPRHRAMLLYALLLGDPPLRAAAAEKFDALRDRAPTEELCERTLVRPEAAGFCIDRGLAPRDPVRRALFYVVTGQARQHRALDPDGSLLGLAYAAAPETERARVREAMLALGDLDLVGVIAGGASPTSRRARLADMSRAEARYLAEHLADRREWDELWAFVQDLPVAAGAELVRLFDRWTPRDEDERAFFRTLRGADPATVQEGFARLGGPPEPYASLRLNDYVRNLSFAPDGRFLAVAGIASRVSVFDTRTARFVRRYEKLDASVDLVLQLGNGVLIASERSWGEGGGSRLYRCADGRRRLLHTTSSHVTSLAPTGDGAGFAGITADGELLLGDADDGVLPLPAGGLGWDGRSFNDPRVAHCGSGRIVAAAGRPGVVLLDAASRSTSVLRTTERVYEAVFLDADTLVCTLGNGTVTRLSLRDGTLAPSERKVFGSVQLSALHRTGEVALIDSSADLHLLGGEPLERRHVRAAPDDPGGCLAVSPDGSLLATGYGGGRVDLFDLRPRELAAVVRSPTANLVPRDLRSAAAVLADGTLAPATRTALELLRAALHHRFRFEVEVGEDVPLLVGEHDISL